MTDNRDHLYAFLGVAGNADDLSFYPDYNEPIETVIRRFAAAFVKSSRALQMLPLAGAHAYRVPTNNRVRYPDRGSSAIETADFQLRVAMREPQRRAIFTGYVSL